MSAATILNERHPVHTLVQQHLRRPTTKIHPEIEPSIVRASIARCGVGIDHLAGEQAMVFTDESVMGKMADYFLFTDRRVLGCVSEKPFDVRYSSVREIDVKTGILKHGVFVTLLDGSKTALTFNQLDQGAGAFFTELMRMPPDQREPPPRAPCLPSEGDPAGARRALDHLGVLDDRTALMLRYVDASLAVGAMPVDIARDFVTRIVLHHRNVHFGRGMSQGRWISAVSMNDLSNLMVQIFGSPLSVTEQPVRTIELASQLKNRANVKAAVSSAIGLASLAVLGVGWVSTPTPPIPRFRMMVADTGPFASFRLQGLRARGLEHEAPGLLHQIDVRLLELEDAVLMRRLARGWSEKTPELMAAPEETIRGRIVEILSAAKGAPPVGSEAQVHAFVSDLPGADEEELSLDDALPLEGALSLDEAQELQQVAQQALASSGPVGARINAAARLMTSRRWDEAAAEYHAIGTAHPEQRGTCWSQVGAALYFLGRYDEAIQWYEAAARDGADAEMMRMNVDEAREAIARR